MLKNLKHRLSLFHHKQHGVGLIEVLVTLMILSISMLGILSLQARSSQINQGILYEVRASVLAADIIDRMRANVNRGASYTILFNEPTPAFVDCDGIVNCTTSDLVDYDLNAWRTTLAATLPQGNGQIQASIASGGEVVVIITIQYIDGRVEDASASGQERTANGINTTPNQFVFRTSI